MEEIDDVAAAAAIAIELAAATAAACEGDEEGVFAAFTAAALVAAAMGRCRCHLPS